MSCANKWQHLPRHTFLCMCYNVQIRDHIHELEISSRTSLPLHISIDVVQDLSRLPFRGSDWPQFLQPSYCTSDTFFSSQSLQYSDEPSSVTYRWRQHMFPKPCDKLMTEDKKINQQNAQINSGLIYYWSITPTCFGPSVEVIIRDNVKYLNDIRWVRQNTTILRCNVSQDRQHVSALYYKAIIRSDK